jgi:geranylgeranyl diphosphate synthase type I
MTKLPPPLGPEQGGGFKAPERPNYAEARVYEYVTLIDERIQIYCAGERQRLEQEKDPLVHASAEAYLNTLESGGSRERGAFTMFAYLDWGLGGDVETALAAATHVEMLQTYFLIVDDIQDGAKLRRGQQTAHLQVEAALNDKNNTRGTRPYMRSEVIEQATKLRAEAYEKRSYDDPFMSLLVLPKHLNTAMQVSRQITALTADGQIKDLSNRNNPHITEAELLELYVEKTALYTFAAPLIVGKTLADGPLSDLELHYIYEFAKPAGRAFQLKNDQKIMEPSDKPEEEILLDIRNGTMTPLVLHALNSDGRNNRTGTRIFQADRDSLWQMLNGRRPSLSRVRAILQDSGAVDHVQELIEQQKAQAQVVLDEAADRCKWPADVVSFLRQLA